MSVKRRLYLSFICVISIALIATGLLRADPSLYAIPAVDLVYPIVKSHVLHELDLPGSELTEKGRNVRGIYLPISRLQSRKVREIVRWTTARIGATAVIIDIKDDRGRVTFTRELKDATKPAHGLVKKMPKLVQALKEEGVYVIGRLVCFKDNQFPRVRREVAIRDKRTGKRWHDRGNMLWIDPYSPTARDYITSIARAAEEMGVDEIQLDYVRFPVEPNSRWARYPSQEVTLERYEAIAALLSQVDREIDIPLSIDVFGLTAYRVGDPEGLGQSLEHLAPHIDAISPMLYLANWPKRAWENPKPSRTRALVHNAVKRIRSRLGEHIAVRPLLQAFKYRALNFGPKFILNQINAAETAGSSGYLFWNQAGNYGKVAAVWRGLNRPHILSPRPEK
ncbi:MAG: hypothetical protein GY847_18865 [Proteobacteria bacterium]|nr:hypothetical protein [Pseudomonadota bacterium]